MTSLLRFTSVLCLVGTLPSGLAAFPPTDASWQRVSTKPVLEATEKWEGINGTVGFGVCEPQVIWEPDQGLFRMWYRGGWGSSNIGVATSKDGFTWTKYAQNPVFPGAQPYVYKLGSTYWLHSSYGGVATSKDGYHWTKVNSSIPFPANASAWGNRVFWKEATEWKMLQEALYTSEGQWKIWLYTSVDGLNWKVGNGGSPLTSLQPGQGSYCGPSFASIDGVLAPKNASGVYHLWYHAVAGAGELPTDIFHATSADLLSWEITPKTPVLKHSGTGFEYDQVADPSPVVVTATGKAYLYYDGDNNTGKGSASIGVVIAPAVQQPMFV